MSIKGYKMSEEHKTKIGKAHRGKIVSQEQKLKMSKAAKIRKVHPFLGKTHSEETKRKMSKSKKGAGTWCWKGGISSLGKQIRNTNEYRKWRFEVYKRDDFICQLCGVKGGKLNADHIRAFSIIMEKHKIDSVQRALICADLWDIANGRTLCVSCHKKTDTYGFKSVKK